jgi:uncharacterized protein (TIGR02611 family)
MESFRKAWRRFRTGEPGSRFRQQFEANQEARTSKWARPAIVALGILVILLGLVALPAPGPGTLVIAAGAALIAREFLWMARLLDSAEVTIRRWLGRLRQRF